MAEVLEAFDARGEDDEQVGVGARYGGEGVRSLLGGTTTRSPVCGDDVLAGQDLGGAVEQEEHSAEFVVPVRFRAVGAVR